jgi:hypothetical protein
MRHGIRREGLKRQGDNEWQTDIMQIKRLIGKETESPEAGSATGS